jgi:hypothetical protein
LLLPLVTSVLSLGFAVRLVVRFAGHRRPYYAIWAFALACFGVSSAIEAVGANSGWSSGLYRWWYLAGAVCVAAYLGAGSLYLNNTRLLHWGLVAVIVVGALPAIGLGYTLPGVLGLFGAGVLAGVALRDRMRFAHAALALLVLATLLMAGQVLTTPLDTAQLPAKDEIATGQAFPQEVRIVTPMFNLPGAAMLLLGAVVSGIGFWRRRDAPMRVASNVLIAVGAIVPSLSSGLTRFGSTADFYTGQLLGVLCLLAGFIVSDVPSARPRLHPSVSSDPSSGSRARAS